MERGCFDMLFIVENEIHNAVRALFIIDIPLFFSIIISCRKKNNQIRSTF